jgi:hypothetical protein
VEWQSVAAARAICPVLNAACPNAAHLVVVLRPTLTLQCQAPVLGARGRGALLDARLLIQAPLVQAPGHPQPRAGGPLLAHTPRRACCRRRAANANATVASAYAAAASYVERTFDPESRDSVSLNADLVRECLYAILAYADRPCSNPLPWCECLQYFILYSSAPALVAYLTDWAAAGARDEACVRAVLLNHCVSARSASAVPSIHLSKDY